MQEDLQNNYIVEIPLAHFDNLFENFIPEPCISITPPSPNSCAPLQLTTCHLIIIVTCVLALLMSTHSKGCLLGTKQSIRKIIRGENRLSVSRVLLHTCISSSMRGTCEFSPCIVAWLLVTSCLLAQATVLLRFHGHIFPFISRVYLTPFHPVLSHRGSEQGS